MNNFAELVKESRDKWSKVGKENGWSMDNRGVTVWVNANMDKVDSLYNPSDSEISYIVDSDTEELIAEIKH